MTYPTIKETAFDNLSFSTTQEEFEDQTFTLMRITPMDKRGLPHGIEEDVYVSTAFKNVPSPEDKSFQEVLAKTLIGTAREINVYDHGELLLSHAVQDETLETSPNGYTSDLLPMINFDKEETAAIQGWLQNAGYLVTAPEDPSAFYHQIETPYEMLAATLRLMGYEVTKPQASSDEANLSQQPTI